VAEESKRQVLDRRVIVERAARATETLLIGLRAAAEADRSRFTLEDWTALLDGLVADVVLDATATPHLRWQREEALSADARPLAGISAAAPARAA
jgi:hypothetical protein